MEVKNVVEFVSEDGCKHLSVATAKDSTSLYITVLEGDTVSTFDVSSRDLGMIVEASEFLLAWDVKCYKYSHMET